MGAWVAIVIFIVISIVLFCCVRVGARADEEMERIMKELFD